jgi:hypothetical protein
MDPAQLHHLLNDERYKYTMVMCLNQCDYPGENGEPCRCELDQRSKTNSVKELGLPNNPYVNPEAIPQWDGTGPVPIGVVSRAEFAPHFQPGQIIYRTKDNTLTTNPIPKMQFDSGAQRGTDKAGVAWHLIHPTIIGAIQDIYRNLETKAIEPDITSALDYMYLMLGAKEIEAYKSYTCSAVTDLFEYVANELEHRPLDHRRHIKGIESIPFSPLQKIAEAYAEGSKKYGAFNCEKGFPIGDLLNHAIAHIMAYCSGADTGEDDLGHACWNLAQVLYLNVNPTLVKDHQLRPDHPISKLVAEHYGKVGS